MDAQVAEMMMDARLSSDARVIGFFIANRGPGAHEISREEFGDVITNDAGRDRVRRALAQLERLAWVTRRPGGRGHFDTFEFSGLEFRGLKIKPPETPSPKTDSRLEPRPLSPIGSSTQDDNNPLISPLAEKALEQHDEKLGGCRGAIRDYLTVLPVGRRQAAYVQTVAAYLDDIDPSVWRLPSGGWLPKPDRTAVLAVALNELAAGDEKMMKRPVGDPANLKTKINILLKQREDKPLLPQRTPRSSKKSGAPQEFDYSNETTEFKGFTA